MVESTENIELPPLVDLLAFGQDEKLMKLIGDGK